MKIKNKLQSKSKNSKMRKQKAKKIGGYLRKIFGGLDCGQSSEKNRNTCNNFIRNKLQGQHTCHMDNNTLMINNININLDNLIGQGQYGKVYLSNISHNNEEYNFIVKEQTIDTDNPLVQIQNEILLTKYLSFLVENNISPHFLHFYTDFSCNYSEKIPGGGKKIIPLLDLVFNYEKKFFLVEKATDTLRKLKSKLKNDFKSLINQIILSIFTFHQYTKHYHLDTHSGNFLYHEIQQQPNMYMKYILDDKNYKLKLSKYIVVLWDYGIAQNMLNNDYLYSVKENFQLENKIPKIMYDYYRILSDIQRNFEKTQHHNNIISNILLKIDKYNIIIKHIMKKSLRLNELNIKKILEIEKKFLNELINYGIIFYNNIHESIISYNTTPYLLENTKNLTISSYSNKSPTENSLVKSIKNLTLYNIS